MRWLADAQPKESILEDTPNFLGNKEALYLSNTRMRRRQGTWFVFFSSRVYPSSCEEVVPRRTRQSALQPREVWQKYEREDVFYNVGRSRGWEQFKGKPDFAMGSFFVNPTLQLATHQYLRCTLSNDRTCGTQLKPSHIRRVSQLHVVIAHPHRGGILLQGLYAHLSRQGATRSMHAGAGSDGILVLHGFCAQRGFSS